MENYLYNISDKLSDSIFEKNVMKDDVRNSLLKIANFAISKSKLKRKYIKDIILTGSLASYNYNEFSDVDLHIIYELNIKDKEKAEIVKKYLDEKRKLLNFKYNFFVKNHKVEIYFQEASEPHESLGIYSILNNKWIKYPEKIKIKINNKEIIKKAKLIIKNIKDTIKNNPKNYEELEEILNDIIDMRKTSLKNKNNIFSIENLTFKLLRKTGILEVLTNYLTELKSKELTIERIN